MLPRGNRANRLVVAASISDGQSSPGRKSPTAPRSDRADTPYGLSIGTSSKCVSPGRSAVNTPVTSISTSAAHTTGRHRGDGSRPSGKYSGINTENGISAGGYTQVCSHNANSDPGSDPGDQAGDRVLRRRQANGEHPAGDEEAPAHRVPRTQGDQHSSEQGHRHHARAERRKRAGLAITGRQHAGGDCEQDDPAGTAHAIAMLTPVPRSPSHAGRPVAGRPAAVNASICMPSPSGAKECAGTNYRQGSTDRMLLPARGIS